MATPRLIATSRVVATLLGTLVLAAAAPALAAAPLQANGASVPKGPTQDRYRKGRIAFDAGRFEEAGQAWADVLDQVPESARNRGLRSKLILDVMSAYRAAYEQSGDVAMLERGLEHYFRYFAVYKETYQSPRIPREVVVARYDLKSMIDEAKKGSPQAAGDDGETGESSENGQTEESTAGEPVSEGSSTREEGGAPVEPTRSSGARMEVSGGGPKDRNGTPLIAAGATVLALGVGASSMIAVGAIEGQRAREDQKMPGFTEEQRDRIDQRGRSMNGLLIAGLVTTPVLVATGAALLAVGAKRRRDRGVAAVSPTFGRSFAGVVVRGRF